MYELVGEHYPTLKTILMVEKALRDMDESVISIAELKRRLPRQVNHNSLKLVLDYLLESNKIFIGSKGVTWIHYSNPALRKTIEEGVEYNSANYK